MDIEIIEYYRQEQLVLFWNLQNKLNQAYSNSCSCNFCATYVHILLASVKKSDVLLTPTGDLETHQTQELPDSSKEKFFFSYNCWNIMNPSN